MDYLLIVIGFVFLIFGADFLVDGACGVAKRFNVPNLVIGLTIVAFGTSAPEMVVNIMASINNQPEIAFTNIIGSNTINTFVILGVASVIFPIVSHRSSRRFDIPISALAGISVVALTAGSSGYMERWAGCILLAIFTYFMTITIRKGIKQPEDAGEDFKPIKMWLAGLMIVGGLVGLIIGGNLIVMSATNIATALGVSQSVIGLTIVALGTSLPELATSAVAAFKKNSDIALGNVIGSNIFNVFFVLGVSAIISPLKTYSELTIDSLIASAGSLLVLLFIYTNKKHKIMRWQGALLLIAYAAYLIYRLQ